MISSKFKTWGVVAMLITIALFAGILFLIYALSSVFFFGGHVMKRGTLSPFEACLFILFLSAMSLIIVQVWRKFFFSVEIDTYNKIISFQNIFSRQRFTYAFSELDGYIDIYAVTKNGNFKVLYLIKEKRAVKTITGYYYANMDEMQEALSSMPYFGKQEDWRTISRRALLGRPVID